jgi:hypothetical protein
MKVILLLLCGRLILYAFLAVRFWKLVAFRCQCPKPVEGKNNNDCVCCIDIDFRSERGLPSGSLLLLIRCEPSSRQQGSHCFPFQCCGLVRFFGDQLFRETNQAARAKFKSSGSRALYKVVAADKPSFVLYVRTLLPKTDCRC